jgi:hypothetical protein
MKQREEQVARSHPCKCEPRVRPWDYELGSYACIACDRLASQCVCGSDEAHRVVIGVNRDTGELTLGAVRNFMVKA